MDEQNAVLNIDNYLSWHSPRDAVPEQYREITMLNGVSVDFGGCRHIAN